jgi:hypothetical protein
VVEELIPIVMFISLALVFIALFWFRYRARSDTQQTVRMALDKGTELTPELIDRLGAPKPRKHKDLRLGVIWMSLAVALILIALINPGGAAEAMRSTLAGAALPFSIGSAYLLLWYFIGRKEE